ncbi:glycosyltransferase [Mameliella sediminis]|uniref:glycosyltransferase n=1 Tax=Mameliella sediminis TaxID=2836866 RepID=UPI001C48B598|nr:glycosyltransferase [Mameliella sediminis]MBV7397356.1 glycosyltransferase [Mameliella sediminis]
MKTCFIGQGRGRGTTAAEAIAARLYARSDVFHRHDPVPGAPDGDVLAALAGDGHDLICTVGAGPATRALTEAKGAARRVVLLTDPDVSEADLDALANRDDIRVISFSYGLHLRAALRGVNSFHACHVPPAAAAGPAAERPMAVFCQQQGGAPDRATVGVLLSQVPEVPVHLFGAGDGALTGAQRLARDCAVHLLPPGAGPGRLLAAMAAGNCVIAPDRPWVRDYLTHGVTGLLYDPDHPEPLDLGAALDIGRRARRSIEQGHRNWQWDLDNRLQAILFQPRLEDPGACRELGAYVRAGLGTGAPAAPGIAEPAPRVSVAVVCYNAGAEIESTLQSVLAQTYRNMETVVVDGGSTDGTPGVLARYRDRLDILVSEPDAGIYDAMNKAARLATGDYVIFINAGDHFHLPGALEVAMHNVTCDRGGRALPDFIIGDHVYRHENGFTDLHKAADFEDTWAQLQSGRFRPGWWQGIPCHQATLTRRALLAERGYDLGFEITADHAFMFSRRAEGARFEHCHAVIATYAGGGISATRPLQCMRESYRVSRAHTRAPGAVADLYRALYGEEAVVEDPGRIEAEAELLRGSGLFCAEWYRARYMEPGCGFRDPVLHYVMAGRRQGTRPHPLFDADHYLSQHPEALDSGQSPFAHYLATGRARGWTPCDPERGPLAGLLAGQGPDLRDLEQALARAPRDRLLSALRDGQT